MMGLMSEITDKVTFGAGGTAIYIPVHRWGKHDKVQAGIRTHFFRLPVRRSSRN